MTGIYVHIPFCERKCNYCAFTSFSSAENTRENYVDILDSEIKSRADGRKINTIYFGGGTPSILSSSQIEKVSNVIKQNFDLSTLEEWTIEANPNSISEEFLKTCKKLGINRISIGVQSLSDTNLKKIGRLHTKDEAIEKIKLAKQYFENISVDIIVGLEGETGEVLCDYAKTLLSLGIKHISCYLLEVYKNTKIFEMIEKKEYTPLDDDAQIDAFEKLSDFLQKNGMIRYEISNFAFPGFESKHNLGYWTREEYFGFGISAHSFLGGERIENAKTLSDYKNGPKKVEKLSDKEILEEIIMLGLRCNQGANINSLKELGYDISKNEYFLQYIKQNILKTENNKIFLNERFYDVSNTIISNLLPN